MGSHRTYFLSTLPVNTFYDPLQAWKRTLYAVFFKQKEPLLQKLYTLLQTSVLEVSSVTASSEIGTASVKMQNIPFGKLVPFSSEDLKSAGDEGLIGTDAFKLVSSGLASLPRLVYSAS